MALVSSSDGSGRNVGNLKEKEGSLLLVGTRKGLLEAWFVQSYGALSFCGSSLLQMLRPRLLLAPSKLGDAPRSVHGLLPGLFRAAKRQPRTKGVRRSKSKLRADPSVSSPATELAVSRGSELPDTAGAQQRLKDPVTGTEERLWQWVRGRVGVESGTLGSCSSFAIYPCDLGLVSYLCKVCFLICKLPVIPTSKSHFGD